MNPDEYAAAQAAISSQVAQHVLSFARFFQPGRQSTASWVQLLRLLFPFVSQARTDSAKLARTFYDSQRAEHYPDLPRNDRDLEDYQFDWFVQNMEPARKLMSAENSPDHAVTTLTLQATREVDNAGRRQMLHAVVFDPGLTELQKAEDEKTPEPVDLDEPSSTKKETATKPATRIIRGWARVATGAHPCAWCLMLVSRGPTYLGADTAGLDLDDFTAQKMLAAGEDVSDFMNQWHPGCKCRVVPVYKSETWPGQAGADKALELWKAATTEGDALIESGDARTDNRNTEALNALRRRIYRGEITGSDYAGLAA